MIRDEYQGFGEKHTAGTWARLLSVPRNTLWRNLKAGMTVEEFAKKKGIEYEGKALRYKHKRMMQTELLARELLKASGYDTRGLRLLATKNLTQHDIFWGNWHIGVYDYKEDVLYLTSGQRLKLLSPIVKNPRIVCNGEHWTLHEETQAAMCEAILQ